MERSEAQVQHDKSLPRPRDSSTSTASTPASSNRPRSPRQNSRSFAETFDSNAAFFTPVDSAYSRDADHFEDLLETFYNSIKEEDIFEDLDIEDLEAKVRHLAHGEATTSDTRTAARDTRTIHTISENSAVDARIAQGLASDPSRANGAGMNQYPLYHDGSNNMQSPNTNFGRGPQSPLPQAQMQQQPQVNGIGGGSNASHGGMAAGNPAGVPNGVLHPGQQIDLNYLWGVVEELSEALAQNRAQTASIIGTVQRMQSRPSNEEDQSHDAVDQETNGEGANSSSTNHAAEIASLRTDIHGLNKQVQGLDSENAALQNLVADYESALQNLMPKLRKYAHEHTVANIALRNHYTSLLDAERETNLQLRLEHGEWQAGLGRATEWARKSLREQADRDSTRLAREAELKYENRVLRRLVGWEIEEDSDDERERAQEEELKRKAAEADSQRATDMESQGGIPGM